MTRNEFLAEWEKMTELWPKMNQSDAAQEQWSAMFQTVPGWAFRKAVQERWRSGEHQFEPPQRKILSQAWAMMQSEKSPEKVAQEEAFCRKTPAEQAAIRAESYRIQASRADGDHERERFMALHRLALREAKLRGEAERRMGGLMDSSEAAAIEAIQ